MFMSFREHPGWRTRLGKFIGRVSVHAEDGEIRGVRAVAQLLSEHGLERTESTIYDWIYGRTPPPVRCAAVLARLSRGRLSVTEICSQPELVHGTMDPLAPRQLGLSAALGGLQERTVPAGRDPAEKGTGGR